MMTNHCAFACPESFLNPHVLETGVAPKNNGVIIICRNQSPDRFELIWSIVVGSWMHYTQTPIAYCRSTGPNRSGGIDECRQSEQGEGWRTSLIFLPLSAGRWPLAQRYEENVTQHYPLSLLQTQMKFYFLCPTVERKQFLLLLINVWYMGRKQEGSKEKISVLSLVPLLCFSLISHVLISVMLAPQSCLLGGTSTI